jgi:hypothetical protein
MNPIYQIPSEIIDELRETNKRILEELESLQRRKDPERFLTKQEFMAEARIGETYMTSLISNKKIKFSRPTAKFVRIPYSELLRFQRGEVQ